LKQIQIATFGSIYIPPKLANIQMLHYMYLHDVAKEYCAKLDNLSKNLNNPDIVWLYYTNENNPFTQKTRDAKWMYHNSYYELFIKCILGFSNDIQTEIKDKKVSTLLGIVKRYSNPFATISCAEGRKISVSATKSRSDSQKVTSLRRSGSIKKSASSTSRSSSRKDPSNSARRSSSNK